LTNPEVSGLPNEAGSLPPKVRIVHNSIFKVMKKLNQELLLRREDELKRRKFLQNAPVVVAFLLAAGATPVHATEEIPIVNDDQIDPV
jgi:hypothetical protein